jgi:hypothetical protein
LFLWHGIYVVLEELWGVLCKFDFVVLFSLWGVAFGFFLGEDICIVGILFRDIGFGVSLFRTFSGNSPFRG